MNSYFDEENNIKAAKVRKLVSQGNMEQAEELSKELGKYLEQKYSKVFKVYNIDEENLYNDLDDFETVEEWRENKYHYHPKNHNILLSIKEYGYKDYQYNKVIFNDEGNIEEIEYKERNNILDMPDNFYDFLERMGLTLKTAAILYNIQRSELLGFQYKENKWPVIINKSLKL